MYHLFCALGFIIESLGGLSYHYHSFVKNNKLFLLFIIIFERGGIKYKLFDTKNQLFIKECTKLKVFDIILENILRITPCSQLGFSTVWRSTRFNPE